MAKLRLLKTGHGDLCLAEWDPQIPETIPQARFIFDRERKNRLIFRLDGPGETSPLTEFDELAPEIILIPAIQGG